MIFYPFLIGIQKTPNEPQLEFILGKEFHLTYTDKYNNSLYIQYTTLGCLYHYIIAYYYIIYKLL